MAKKKSSSIYEYEIGDSDILGNSDVLSFAAEPPQIFEETLERLKKSLKYNDPQTTPLEFILRRFEKEAKQVLAHHGYPTELNELLSLESDHTHFVKLEHGGSGYKCDVDIQSLSAKSVLFSASNLRNFIANNDAEKASLEMMRLLYATFNMSGFEFFMRGVRAKKGSLRGGQAPKKAEGILLAIDQVLKKTGKKMSKEEVWRHFKRNTNTQDRMEVGEYEIFFDKLAGLDYPDLLVEEHQITGKMKSITKSTFFRHYMKKN